MVEVHDVDQLDDARVFDPPQDVQFSRQEARLEVLGCLLPVDDLQRNFPVVLLRVSRLDLGVGTLPQGHADDVAALAQLVFLVDAVHFVGESDVGGHVGCGSRC